MHPKILIVGTVPYNKKMTSRAFESYFCDWEKENLAQIFSDPQPPVKGHCETLYQITDQRLLKRRLSASLKVGKVFHYDELEDDYKNEAGQSSHSLISLLYKFGRRKRPLTYLLRGWLWRKKYWCTDELNRWLDDFAPDCVFLSFSDDFFIPRIALYAAKRYNIPIVSSVGDDYFFNTRFSLSPFYHLYKSKFRKLIRTVFSHPGSAIYISDKIKDKYNTEFQLNGQTVYLSSELSSRPFRPISVAAPVISYFGNIRGGRNKSLDDIGFALGKINPDYKLHVFSNEPDKINYAPLLKNPNICYHGAIPYSQVLLEIPKSDICIVVEGFATRDINLTRYSLSTKVADSLASGVAVFAYGSPQCGAIEYMQQIGCAEVCTDKAQLVSALRHLIDDTGFQESNYHTALRLTTERHNVKQSAKVFEAVVQSAMKGRATRA